MLDGTQVDVGFLFSTNVHCVQDLALGVICNFDHLLKW